MSITQLAFEGRTVAAGNSILKRADRYIRKYFFCSRIMSVSEVLLVEQSLSMYFVFRFVTVFYISISGFDFTLYIRKEP